MNSHSITSRHTDHVPDRRGTHALAWRQTSCMRTLACALLLTIGVGGCASTGPGGGLGGLFEKDGAGAREKPFRRIPLQIERKEAPPDYDVLVAAIAQQRGDFEEARAAYERAALKDPESAFIHDKLARLAWQLEDVEGAVREAEYAFELDPESMEVRLFLGRLYRLQRNFEGLDRVLRDEEGEPLDADSAFALFQVAFERGEFDEAENLAKRLQVLEPDQLRGTLARTRVYEQRSDFEAAEATIRKALIDFPEHFLLSTRLAQIKRERGDAKGEIAVYREILLSDPRHYGILQRLAQAQIDQKDVEGGVETYKHIVELYPDDQHSRRRLATLEFSLGRYAEAAEHLENVLARDPDEPEVAFALGQIRNAMDEPEKALEAFERVTAKSPLYVDARVQIAAIYEEQGKTEAALEEVERARSIRRHRLLDFQASALRIELGDFEGGVALLQGMLDGSEKDTEIYYQLGIHYGTRGDTDEALSYMQRVLEAEPNNANALNFVGYSWAERGENLEEAEQLVRRALEIAPKDGYITDSLGWVYFKMAEAMLQASRRDEALRLLDRAHAQLLQAAELTGGDSVVSEHLGDVLLLRGDKRGALERYEEAVRLEIREDEQPNLLDKLNQVRRDLGISTPTEAP